MKSGVNITVKLRNKTKRNMSVLLILIQDATFSRGIHKWIINVQLQLFIAYDRIHVYKCIAINIKYFINKLF